MFPPFPIPGFAPNFTGFDEYWHEIDWYELYKFMAQAPNVTVMWVSFQCSYLQLMRNEVSRLNVSECNRKQQDPNAANGLVAISSLEQHAGGRVW